MSDTPSPIVVNASAAQPTLQALLRQLVTVAGVATGALGLTHLSSEIGALAVVAGPLATLIAMGWGLWSTFDKAQKSAAMANMLPDNQAKTK
jgi:hypothetical protein